jgi:hypothetical protein
MVYFTSRPSTNGQQGHYFGEFFSDLASKNYELLASLASALKILIPPLNTLSSVFCFMRVIAVINKIK